MDCHWKYDIRLQNVDFLDSDIHEWVIEGLIV